MSAAQEAPTRPRTRPKFLLKHVIWRFLNNALIDSAAALTFFTVLSIFPAIIALVSILSLVGQSGALLRDLIVDLESRGALPAGATDFVMPVLDTVLATPSAGWGLLVGLVVALWTSSNYVRAFGRAMNKVYGVPEGRNIVKLYAWQYGLTGSMLLLVAVSLVVVAVSGPILESLGNVIGLGDLLVRIHSWAKWPIMVVLLMALLDFLYWGAPNVRQTKFRLLSVGSALAIIGSGAASAGFGFYVSRFGNFDATYGALASVIVFLLWAWIVNIVILFGATLDVELLRVKQLKAGIEAEEQIQLPLRDDKGVETLRKQEERAVASARRVRRKAEQWIEYRADE